MRSYKTVNKDRGYALFFVAKAEKGERGGKGLTGRRRYGIITELSWRRHRRRRAEEEVEKTLKKVQETS